MISEVVFLETFGQVVSKIHELIGVGIGRMDVWSLPSHSMAQGLQT